MNTSRQRILAGLVCLLLLAGLASEVAAIEETVSPQVLALIGDWAARQAGK